MPGHTPVLFQEVLSQLNLHPNDLAIDATLGGGGHTRGLLDAVAPNGRVLGIEADPRTLTKTTLALGEYGSRFVPVQGNFRNIKTYGNKHHFSEVAAILFDCGLSSLALDDARRGFSFQLDGPLDMRFDPGQPGSTAAELVNETPVSRLTEIFRQLGEERQAERVAKAIEARRQNQPFTTTLDLAATVAAAIGRRGAKHPATKVFQALRMAVNDELGALRDGLTGALDLLQPGGRIAVITFHSIEDRVAKTWMRSAAADGCLQILTQHVLTPKRAEQLSNPRSRSAKLRVAEKISHSQKK